MIDGAVYPEFAQFLVDQSIESISLNTTICSHCQAHAVTV